MRKRFLGIILLAVMIAAIVMCVSGDAKAERNPSIASRNDTATATITITWRTAS